LTLFGARHMPKDHERKKVRIAEGPLSPEDFRGGIEITKFEMPAGMDDASIAEGLDIIQEWQMEADPDPVALLRDLFPLFHRSRKL